VCICEGQPARHWNNKPSPRLLSKLTSYLTCRLEDVCWWSAKRKMECPVARVRRIMRSKHLSMVQMHRTKQHAVKGFIAKVKARFDAAALWT